jgi:hypothetical protein
MRVTRHVLAAATAALAAFPAAAAAAPGAGEVTSFAAAFTTQRPHAASGLVLETTGRPPVPPTTVAPVVRQTVALPRGARMQLDRLPQCGADDAALAAQGAQVACPPATRAGDGRAEGVLDGAPIGFDLGVYAIRGRLFFAAEAGGQPLKRGFWGMAQGRRLILDATTSGGRIAPTLFRARIAARGAWLRTPVRCPERRSWRFTGTFTPLWSVSDTTPLAPVQVRYAQSACVGDPHRP